MTLTLPGPAVVALTCNLLTACGSGDDHAQEMFGLPSVLNSRQRLDPRALHEIMASSFP